MQDLNISIRKARIEGFSVTLKDDLPEVTATISLLTEGGKKITSYTIGSEHWEDSLKFHLPHEIVGPVVEIARILEHVVADHCQSAALRLPAPAAQGVTVNGYDHAFGATSPDGTGPSYRIVPGDRPRILDQN